MTEFLFNFLLLVIALAILAGGAMGLFHWYQHILREYGAPR